MATSDLPARCEDCGAVSHRAVLETTAWCCPACDFNLPIPARERLQSLADPGSIQGLTSDATGGDPLAFTDSKPYVRRLEEARARTGEGESFISVACTVGGVDSVVGAFDFAFMGGTMSSAVGERVVEAFELGRMQRRPVVLCTASGGARMQEGTLSLFQMAKCSAARARLREAGVPYVAVLGHPTLGGVAASFGAQADICLAEPRARIGFAGPRLIEQLAGSALPEGFQRAEFLQRHGFVDRVVHRRQLRDELVRLVRLLSGRPASDGSG